MFKHILLPTDGSELSEAAIQSSTKGNLKVRPSNSWASLKKAVYSVSLNGE